MNSKLYFSRELEIIIMLHRLTVKNFALLRDTELIFKQGLTAITGETGTGKSLLVEAISFLGGGRVAPGMVRDGAHMALIEAEFTSIDDTPVILRRELHAKGRTRAFRNDSPISTKILAQTAATLFDITSQRAFSHLLEPLRHVDFLDLFAGLIPERKELEGYEKDYQSFQRRISILKRHQNEFRQKREIISFKLDQINSVDPQPGEEDELAVEVKRLEHFEDLHRDGGEIINLLIDNKQAVDYKLGEAKKLLESVTDLDSTLIELLNELESAQSAIREIARRIEERCLRVSYEANWLEKLRERQHAISGLVRKFGGTFTALLEQRESLRIELISEETTSRELQNLITKRDHLINKWVKLAERVSAIRMKKAKQLEKRVVGSLAKLGIKDAQFNIQLQRIPDSNGLIEMDNKRWRLDKKGGETVEFYLSANPGLEPRPLAQVASGGELSRLLLALKETLPAVSGEVAIIFDEIDTGVSGRIAHLVARKLKELSAERQMIAITHLPQIAGMADQHIKIDKKPLKGEIETLVKKLDSDHRIHEIATMLSGGKVTEAALEQARNLIET